MQFMEDDRAGSAHKRTYTPISVRAHRDCHIVPESEKALEARLRREVEARGGKAIKLTSQLHRGLPDRLILMPEGQAFFVEVKTTGRKPTKLQRAVHRDLRAMGFDVFVVDSTASLEKVVALIDRAVLSERLLKEELGL